MSKSQRIRQTFTENLLELRNPMITGRQRINKKYLMQGKKDVQAAIKYGKKTGDHFSKDQLADIAQQRTDKPEIRAEKLGGGKKLPPELGPSDRQVATKKALMRQTDSTNHVGPFIKESNAARRAALRALRARHNLPGSNPTSAEIGHRAGRAVAAYQSPWTPAGSKGAHKGITDLAKKYGAKAKKDPQEFSKSSDALDQDADTTYRGVEREEKGEPTSYTTGIKKGILTGRKILQGVRSRMQPQNSSTNYAREGLKALFESVLDEVSQRAANKAYWEGEGKDFKGAGRKLAKLTKKFQAQQGEKSPFRTPNPNDPSDWGIDPIPDENVNVGGKSSKGPDKSDEKMRSPHFN